MDESDFIRLEEENVSGVVKEHFGVTSFQIVLGTAYVVVKDTDGLPFTMRLLWTSPCLHI